MAKARVIYNPKSGKEQMKKYLPDVLNILETEGYETSAFATTADVDSAKNEAYRCARAGFDLLVVAGGDGTINEVVNGIAPLRRRPKMAIIPGGTTNDYARALMIPRNNPVEAIQLIRKKQTIKMDSPSCLTIAMLSLHHHYKSCYQPAYFLLKSLRSIFRYAAATSLPCHHNYLLSHSHPLAHHL